MGGGATTEDIQFIGFIPHATTPSLFGTTSPWANNGLVIAANTCVAGPTVKVPGVTTSMAIFVTPAASFPAPRRITFALSNSTYSSATKPNNSEGAKSKHTFPILKGKASRWFQEHLLDVDSLGLTTCHTGAK